MATEREHPPLSGLEREVMEVVWSSEAEVSVRDVVERMNESSEKKRAYTTLMTIMGRLEGKGMLTKRTESKVGRFRAAVDRDEYLRARAEAEIDALVGEYGEVARALFVREIERSDPEAASKLRAIIDGES